MPLSEQHPLSGSLAMARSEIRQADILSAQLMVRNVPAHLGNVRDLLAPTDEIERAMEEVAEAAQLLQATLTASHVHHPLLPDGARAAALQAVDRLEGLLEAAQPSEEAALLGLGW